MSWEGFLTNFLSELLATILGLVLGIPIGIWLNRKFEHWRKEQEEQKEIKLLQKEKRTVLKSLESEFEYNIKLLKEIKEKVRDRVIFGQFNLSAWKAFSSKITNIIDNYTLLMVIQRVYFEYEHLQLKINKHFDLHFSAAKALSNFKDLFENLNQSIYDQISLHLLELSEKTLNLIRLESEKLNEEK